MRFGASPGLVLAAGLGDADGRRSKRGAAAATGLAAFGAGVAAGGDLKMIDAGHASLEDVYTRYFEGAPHAA